MAKPLWPMATANGLRAQPPVPMFTKNAPPAMPSSQAAAQYNVTSVPTYFLIDKDNVLQKRDSQIKDLEEEIKGML